MPTPTLRIQSNQTNATYSAPVSSSVSQKNTPVVRQPFTPKPSVSGGSARLTF